MGRCMHGEVYININYVRKYSSISKRRNWYSYEKNVDADFLVVSEPESHLIYLTHPDCSLKVNRSPRS